MTTGTNKTAEIGDSAPGVWTRIARAVDERLGLSALRYPVPRHGNTIAWTLGGVATHLG